MILKNKSFILSLLILSCIVIIIIYNQDTMKPPTPTEYVEKKKNKKEFKQNRKEWIENMHKSDPTIDWRQIDKVNRKNNTDRIRILRNDLLDSLLYEKPSLHSLPIEVPLSLRNLSLFQILIDGNIT